MSNQDLIKLLFYTDKDPLSKPDLTDEQKRKDIYEKVLKVIPRIGPKEDAKSVVSVIFTKGTKNSNSEFKDFLITIEVIVPLTQWIIKDENLRPYKIMGEIQKSLDGKSINGLGKMRGGDFTFNYVTEEVSSFIQTFMITDYD